MQFATSNLSKFQDFLKEIDGNMSTWIFDNMSIWFYLFIPVTKSCRSKDRGDRETDEKVVLTNHHYINAANTDATTDTFRQCGVVWPFFVKHLEVRLWLITRSWACALRISGHACCSADTIRKRKDETKGLSDVHPWPLLMTKLLVMVMMTPRRRRR